MSRSRAPLIFLLVDGYKFLDDRSIRVQFSKPI